MTEIILRAENILPINCMGKNTNFMTSELTGLDFCLFGLINTYIFNAMQCSVLREYLILCRENKKKTGPLLSNLNPTQLGKLNFAVTNIFF